LPPLVHTLSAENSSLAVLVIAYGANAGASFDIDELELQPS
jgi:hypothetical protein